MDLFTQLFGSLLAFVYHCFDRIVIYGYLSGLSRPPPPFGAICHFCQTLSSLPDAKTSCRPS